MISGSRGRAISELRLTVKRDLGASNDELYLTCSTPWWIAISASMISQKT
jgi:hypothetical protein